MPETTPLIKAALNLRVGAGFDVYLFFPFMTVFDTNRPKYDMKRPEKKFSGRFMLKMSGFYERNRKKICLSVPNIFHAESGSGYRPTGSLLC